MADLRAEDALTARRQLEAVVPLVVEADERVLYGELVDAETGRQQRFSRTGGLGQLIDAWVTEKTQSLAH